MTENPLQGTIRAIIAATLEADFVFANDDLVHGNYNDLADAVAERVASHFLHVGWQDNSGVLRPRREMFPPSRELMRVYVAVPTTGDGAVSDSGETQ